jgi:hypothetical protein
MRLLDLLSLAWWLPLSLRYLVLFPFRRGIAQIVVILIVLAAIVVGAGVLYVILVLPPRPPS